jgi:chromosome segregation ATPase
MHRGVAVAIVLLGWPAMNAYAQQGVSEIFKCRNEQGQVTYTNDRRQAEKQKCESVASQINVAPAPKPPAGRSPGFPRESASQSASARERQRQVLERELATEREMLSQAKQALAEQEAVRSGDERNYARVLERLRPYKDTVENHEKNIQALQRELANLK